MHLLFQEHAFMATVNTYGLGMLVLCICYNIYHTIGQYWNISPIVTPGYFVLCIHCNAVFLKHDIYTIYNNLQGSSFHMAA
jgi:hypothetical protein